MRGTLILATNRQSKRRFIPAHAGNSAAGLVVKSQTPVHPRACGELYLILL